LLLVFIGTVFANFINKDNGKKDFNVVDTQMAEVKKMSHHHRHHRHRLPPPPPEINQVKFTPPKVVKG
jgi:hypothetical protein